MQKRYTAQEGVKFVWGSILQRKTWTTQPRPSQDSNLEPLRGARILYPLHWDGAGRQWVYVSYKE